MFKYEVLVIPNEKDSPEEKYTVRAFSSSGAIIKVANKIDKKNKDASLRCTYKII